MPKSLQVKKEGNLYLIECPGEVATSLKNHLSNAGISCVVDAGLSSNGNEIKSIKIVADEASNASEALKSFTDELPDWYVDMTEP